MCSFSNSHDCSRLEKSVSAGCVGTRDGSEVWVCGSNLFPWWCWCRAGTTATTLYAGHLPHFGLDWATTITETICWKRFHLKNRLYLSMTEKKTWSLSVFLLGSFHNKFLDASLLICCVSWGRIQIWSFKRYLSSSFIWIQWYFCCGRWQEFLPDQHHFLCCPLSVSKSLTWSKPFPLAHLWWIPWMDTQIHKVWVWKSNRNMFRYTWSWNWFGLFLLFSVFLCK